MLATAPRQRFGAFSWAAVSGIFGSAPAAIQDLTGAYFTTPAVPLVVGRLIDVGLLVFFIALLFASFIRETGPTSGVLLAELFPQTAAEIEAAARTRRWWEFWK
jgi:hypothetical protein